VVRTPLVERMSLTATGMPSRGEAAVPLRNRASARSACSRAESRVRVIKALTVSSRSSMRRNTDSVISLALTSRFLSISASSAALWSHNSIYEPSRILGTLK